MTATHVTGHYCFELQAILASECCDFVAAGTTGNTQDMQGVAPVWQTICQRSSPERSITAVHISSIGPAPPSADSGVKLTKDSKLTVEFGNQLEQSGLLHLLPGLISSSVQQLQAALAAGQFSYTPATKVICGRASILLQLVGAIPLLLPAFISVQALNGMSATPTGLRCVAPTMQWVMISIQVVSKAVRGGSADDAQLDCFVEHWLAL